VYVVAKRMSKRCTIEQYAIALAQHFVHTYPRVRRGRGDGGDGGFRLGWVGCICAGVVGVGGGVGVKSRGGGGDAGDVPVCVTDG
jgi:hypothetical protein